MKKLIFGLLVAATAVGTSAFTSANEKTTHRAGIFYATDPTIVDGQSGWTISSTPAACTGTTDPCQIEYLGTGTPPSSVSTNELETNSRLYRIESRKN